MLDRLYDLVYDLGTNGEGVNDMATATATAGNYIYRHSKYQKIGKAVDCKIVRRVPAVTVLRDERDTYMSRGFIARVCECGGWATGERVIGKFSNKKMCDSRCMGSKGTTCECSCGGANHGASY